MTTFRKAITAGLLMMTLAALAVDSIQAHPRRGGRAVRGGTVVVRPSYYYRPYYWAGDPWYWGPHYYGYYHHPAYYGGRPVGALDMDVTPEETLVYVDGRLVGEADDFDGMPTKLYLRPGKHKIRLEAPWGSTWSRTIRVVAGREYDIDVRLR